MVLLLIYDMIIYTSPNTPPPPLWMWNGHQRRSIYQPLLIFNVNLPPQGMNLIIIITFLRNTTPMLLPNCIQSDILLLIQVRISLLHHLVLRNIYIYIINITQAIKHRQIYNFSKHEKLSNLRIPKNSQQFTLFFFGRM